MPNSIWIGFDSREADSYAVAHRSAARLSIVPTPIYPLILQDLCNQGFYTRPVEKRDGLLWDPISEWWMSTEFANSRFLVPQLAKQVFKRESKIGWALFVDCDVLFRVDPQYLFNLVDPNYAVMCVKHNHNPDTSTKMDGQIQSKYNRKNWSSVMLINCDHPSHADLWEKDLVNKLPGRDLHAFCWLDDDEIGEVPLEWNYLVGYYSKEDCPSPSIVHFTEGIPRLKEYENSEYANEWWEELTDWARKL